MDRLVVVQAARDAREIDLHKHVEEAVDGEIELPRVCIIELLEQPKTLRRVQIYRDRTQGLASARQTECNEFGLHSLWRTGRLGVGGARSAGQLTLIWLGPLRRTVSPCGFDIGPPLGIRSSIITFPHEFGNG